MVRPSLCRSITFRSVLRKPINGWHISNKHGVTTMTTPKKSWLCKNLLPQQCLALPLPTSGRFSYMVSLALENRRLWKFFGRLCPKTADVLSRRLCGTNVSSLRTWRVKHLTSAANFPKKPSLTERSLKLWWAVKRFLPSSKVRIRLPFVPLQPTGLHQTTCRVHVTPVGAFHVGGSFLILTGSSLM